MEQLPYSTLVPGEVAICPPLFAKTHSSVRLSVKETLTCLISSEVLMIEH